MDNSARMYRIHIFLQVPFHVQPNQEHKLQRMDPLDMYQDNYLLFCSILQDMKLHT